MSGLTWFSRVHAHFVAQARKRATYNMPKECARDGVTEGATGAVALGTQTVNAISDL